MTTRRRSARRAPNTTPMLVRCRHCREYFDYGSTTEVEGVCPECFEGMYGRCEECGGFAKNDDLVATSGGRGLCPRCARRVAFHCVECGGWHECGSVHSIVNRSGERVCEGCQEGYERCGRCGDWYRRSEMVDRDDGDAMCFSCADDADCVGIQSYYYKPSPVFHRGAGETDGSLLLGVELEIDEGDRGLAAVRIAEACGNDWLYIKHDGSLPSGMEIVTHPISPVVMLSEEGRAMWRSVTDIARSAGMRSHDAGTCGLHVHVNRDYFGKSETARLMAELKLLGVADRFFEPLAIFSRRKRDRLERWANRLELPRSHDGWRKRAEVAHSMGSNDRYHAVNIQNSATIEFRLFRGTLRLDTLFATFEFVSGLCALAKASTPGQLEKMTWYELCDGVIERCPCATEELENYLIDKELMTKGELQCA